jgi:hypothetical protein
LSPVSDMSEFEPKPYVPASPEPSNAAPVVEEVQSVQPPAYVPLVKLSPEREALADADIARRMPKLRVVERVPILKLYLILSVIGLALPLIYFLILMGRVGMSGFSFYLLGPIALMTIAPMGLAAAITAFLFVTKNAKAATIVLTIMLTLGAISLLLSIANVILVLTRGFNASSGISGLLVSGLLLYFLYRVRQATAVANHQEISGGSRWKVVG